jgi:activating signal cointegrator complex subunit 3
VFVEPGVLDVMQIFGRAGRPQFDASGEGIIITTHDKLNHYLHLMHNALPIESQFLPALTDHLNAEVVLGTVSNTAEAVAWLTYTYCYVRMMRNPMHYGIPYHEIQADPRLYTRCVNPQPSTLNPKP